ncbi:MAG: biotin--[acetyl-CoA-carboxylase] ligase [Elusimicrobia bacterium]|nr:biotin--[acetyl-CoA-carboxylase] ligase [Elusimicrobiota bacterium]MDE2426184.1 biotin--[acetyl-CoA-carboxylase] ligase [Elusimicrobiota bacterium]
MLRALPGVCQTLHLTETDSTQTVARLLAEQGAPDGTLVWADRQRRGRGRLKRSWQSKPGGLYATLILRPSLPPRRLAEVGLLAGAAVAAALARHAGVRTLVKPPNDVLALGADGRRRKLSGILCEAAGSQSRLDWLLLGLGVNVDNAVSLPGATSLRRLTGRSWEVEGVLRAVLAELRRRLPR